MIADQVLALSKELSDKVNSLEFSLPVTNVYNPLDYAWEPFALYVRKYATSKKEAVFVGMNPGPFGMAQTGVPFGDISIVRDWLAIKGSVTTPENEHPKRPIQGFDCPRSEVSGSRLWGWAKNRYPDPKQFFKRFFVWNYCPLCFMGESGKNITPDKLPKEEREQLFQECDVALASLIEVLRPSHVIGVGKFAQQRAQSALAGSTHTGIAIETVLHPSPASPAANRGWQQQAEAQLEAMGIVIPS